MTQGMVTAHVDLEGTGMRITLMRKAHRLSVRDLADMLGFNSVQSIYKWQRGECLPTIDNLIVLSRIFETAIDDILVVADGAAQMTA